MARLASSTESVIGNGTKEEEKGEKWRRIPCESVSLACHRCQPLHSFDCELDGYDCEGADTNFTITVSSLSSSPSMAEFEKRECAVLECPEDNLVVDGVAVTSVTCSTDGNW